MEEQIRKDIEAFMIEHCSINVNKIDETSNFYLLGIMPRDVVKLVLLIEDKYSIHFSEKELVRNRFDSIADIILTIKQYMNK